VFGEMLLALTVISFSLPLDDIKADPALTGLTDNVDVCRIFLRG
jgi:hypothetical protein